MRISNTFGKRLSKRLLNTGLIVAISLAGTLQSIPNHAMAATPPTTYNELASYVTDIIYKNWTNWRFENDSIGIPGDTDPNDNTTQNFSTGGDWYYGNVEDGLALGYERSKTNSNLGSFLVNYVNTHMGANSIIDERTWEARNAMNVYLATGNTGMLNKAKSLADYVLDNGEVSAGRAQGLHPILGVNEEYKSMHQEADLFGLMSYLYKETNDKKYLRYAEHVAEAIFMNAVDDNGVVEGTLRDNINLSWLNANLGTDYMGAVGNVIDGLVALYTKTSDVKYLNKAKIIADGVISNITSGVGIFNGPGMDGQSAQPLIRGMLKLAQATSSQSYTDWIVKGADYLWNNGTSSSNASALVFSKNWIGGEQNAGLMGTGDAVALFNAAAILKGNTTLANPISGNWGNVTRKQSTDSSIKYNGSWTTNGSQRVSGTNSWGGTAQYVFEGSGLFARQSAVVNQEARGVIYMDGVRQHYNGDWSSWYGATSARYGAVYPSSGVHSFVLAAPGPDWKTGGPGVDTSIIRTYGNTPAKNEGPVLGYLDIKGYVSDKTPSDMVMAYNNEGVADDGNRYEIADGTGFDFNGSAFSMQSLAFAGARSETVTNVGGVNFWLPRLNRQALNNIVLNGQDFEVAGGQYKNIYLIGAGTNKTGGSGDASGTLTLTYTDNSTETKTLEFNGWDNGSGTYASNSTAFTSNGYIHALYNISDAGNLTKTTKISNVRKLWKTSVAVNPSKTLKKITWPTQSGNTFMHVFAMTLKKSDDTYQTTTGTYGNIVPKPYQLLSLEQDTVRVSASSTDAGNPYFTVDGKKGRNETSWISKTLPANLDIDMNHRKDIKKIIVYSGQALTGGAKFIKPLLDFKLQYWTGSAWTDIPGASVTSNNEAVKIFDNLSVSSNKIRLYVTKAYDDTARVFEVELYGYDSSDNYPSSLPAADPNKQVLGDAYVPDNVSYLYEAEDLSVGSSSGNTIQTLADTNTSGSQWVKFNSSAVSNYIAFNVNVKNPGTYAVYAGSKSQYERGIFQLSVDGTNVGNPVDMYTATDKYKEFYVGTVTIDSNGNKSFKFTVTGKTGTSYSLGLDYIRLESILMHYEAENITPQVSSGSSHSVLPDSLASGGKFDKFTGNANGDFIEYPLNVTAAGTYKVLIGTKNQSSRGKYQLKVDGTNQGGVIDNYSAADTYVRTDLGNVTFNSAGIKKFNFALTNSTLFTLGIDYIDLIKQ